MLSDVAMGRPTRSISHMKYPRDISQQHLVKMSKYLFNLVVVYADEARLQPDEAVTEINNQSCDINSGFGGKYVWLQPEWVRVHEEAIADLSVTRSDAPIKNYNDLAMGAGGQFWYIQPSRGGSRFITKVSLFQAKQELSPEKIMSRIERSGFTHHSGDINEGRGGDYLYLIWAY
ncbi:hypothetical protein F4810DRAFT_407757 [Camillea tinctor]|nr:hypothetical protein F4810DRAFT_407757 [Camillea tinctor]